MNLGVLLPDAARGLQAGFATVLFIGIGICFIAVSLLSTGDRVKKTIHWLFDRRDIERAFNDDLREKIRGQKIDENRWWRKGAFRSFSLKDELDLWGTIFLTSLIWFMASLLATSKTAEYVEDTQNRIVERTTRQVFQYQQNSLEVFGVPIDRSNPPPAIRNGLVRWTYFFDRGKLDNAGSCRNASFSDGTSLVFGSNPIDADQINDQLTTILLGLTKCNVQNDLYDGLYPVTLTVFGFASSSDWNGCAGVMVKAQSASEHLNLSLAHLRRDKLVEKLKEVQRSNPSISQSIKIESRANFVSVEEMEKIFGAFTDRNMKLLSLESRPDNAFLSEPSPYDIKRAGIITLTKAGQCHDLNPRRRGSSL